MTYNFDTLLNDQQIQKIGYKAALKFKKQLSKEELDQCFAIALWKACEKYELNFKGNKASFSTYFYKGVLFECMKALKKYTSYKEHIEKIKLSKNFNKIVGSYTEEKFAEIDAKDWGLNKKDSELLIEKFWNKKTFKEIGKEQNVSAQATEKRIKKILAKIKIARV